MLLERPGELVTREEICQKLWSTDTFVDFEVGLNSVVRKLRQALGDDADNPHYIETLAKRGYRFLATVAVTVPEKPVVESAPAAPAPHCPLALPANDPNSATEQRITKVLCM